MSDTAEGPGWWQASDGRWYPPGPPSGGPVQNAGKATATLVLGILAFFTCPILAIAALIVGSQATKQIQESGGRLGGEGLVKTGRILAIVNLVFAVLTIPIMAAIAVPTFLGARERAQDRAAQSELRNAFTAERVYRVDHDQWTDDPAQLQAIESSLAYARGATPTSEGTVYVAVQDDNLGLSRRSGSGTCFYLVQLGGEPDSVTGYAQDDDCGAIQDQELSGGWE
jgi:type IV pilus assembly protein PilA